MTGPGKYDFLCTMVRERARAQGALIIIREGYLGEGFSAQLSLEDTLRMPNILRQVADQIEADGPELRRAPDTETQNKTP